MSRSRNIKRIDIFPHIGRKIPERIKHLLRNDLTPGQISYTLETDFDTGIDKIAASYRERPASGQKLMIFEYTKILANVNRLEPEKQVPDTPYKGEQIIKITPETRSLLVEKYIKPWQMQVIELVRANPYATVLHWHSMSVYSGGIANVQSDSDKPKRLRPLGQIFTRTDARKSSLLPYFPSFGNEIQEAILLSPWKSDEIALALTSALAPLVKLGKRKVVKDYPYTLFGERNGKRIFGPSLLNLVAAANENRANKQLTFEFRKDIFKSASAVKALRTVVDEMVNVLN